MAGRLLLVVPAAGAGPASAPRPRPCCCWSPSPPRPRTLTLGLALNEVVTEPYQQTRAATAGPDVVAEPRATGPEALAALAPLTTAAGVTDHSGPFPVAFLTMTAHGTTVQAVVEGRDTAPASLDRPAVTDGTWVRPGGVVLERAFADALGVHTGDTVSIGGRTLRVVGIAVTAARVTYPYAGWHFPGSPMSERGGLVWVDPATSPRSPAKRRCRTP